MWRSKENAEPDLWHEWIECKVINAAHRILSSYLKVRHDFAERASKEPCFGDVHDQAGGETREGDQHVGKGQVDNEIIGHRPHMPVFPHSEANWK